MLQEGFPINLKADVIKVMGLLPQMTSNNVTTVEYVQNGQVIKFPYRIYNSDSSDQYIDTLSEQQKMILHCIYSRHCDGFVRKKHLNALLLMDFEDWAIPYIVKVCDEYVVEIVEMTYEILKEKDTASIRRFCIENMQTFCKGYSRMTSYWNEYYRDEYKNFHQYIGWKLFIECFGYSRAMERSLNRRL